MSIPLKDSLLVAFSANFDARIGDSPETFGLTAAQAARYRTLSDSFVACYNVMMAARAEGTRSESQTAAKETAKAALLRYGRELYAYVQANSSVSDADKVLLGVHVRSSSRTSVPAPAERPATNLVAVVARTVTISVHDNTSSTRRRKPEGAAAAFVYTCVGEQFPTDPALWQFQGAYTKPKIDIPFPSTTAGGAQVWLCAAWVNRRGERGPLSIPITTNLQGGGAVAPAGIRMAA